MANSSIDTAIAGVFEPFAAWISGWVFYTIPVFGASISFVVLIPAATMIFLTVYFRFINLRSFKLALDILKGHYHDEKASGEVSQFRALSAALSGTVGIGNIAGVGAAIGTGGPGATFWMIIIGLAAMSVKFAECSLGVKYRKVHADGSVSGGAMYYLKYGLKARGLPKLGLFLASAYAVFAIASILQWVVVNQMYSQTKLVLAPQLPGWLFGMIIAGLTGMVVIGGVKNIAKVTSRLVPFMVIIYLSAALYIILGHISAVPMAFVTIFEAAFNPDAVAGGVLGVIIIGMRRAVYSTEAGLGTSSIVHAAAKTNEPISEGMVGLIEPFIDTVIIGTITALVIVISGQYDSGLQAIALTSKAFETSISWFPIVLTVALLLFGYSSLITWGYYMEKVWTFVFGNSATSIKTVRILYIVFIVPGSILTATQVFDIIDSLFFLLIIPNVIGLMILAPEVKQDLSSYLRRLKSGEIKKQMGHTNLN